MTDGEIVEKLRVFSGGLLVESESDYPFEVFLWENSRGEEISAKTVLQRVGCGSRMPVTEESPDRFFNFYGSDEDWYGAEEMKTSARFRDLYAVVLELLSGVRVFRVGGVSIGVFIVGRTPSGSLAGLSTMLVET